MEKRHLQLGVVAIEKEAFESTSTKVINFTFLTYIVPRNDYK